MNPRLIGRSPFAATNNTRTLFVGVLFMTMCVLFASQFGLRSYAQENTSNSDDLSTVIKAAILADPRANGLSSEHIDAMVAVLTQHASAQGMSAHDLLWRPLLARTIESVTTVATAQDDCGTVPASLCIVKKSLGLNGSGVTLFVWGGVALTLLIAIIAGILEIRHWRNTHTGTPQTL
jgi:hypothetical protein